MGQQVVHGLHLALGAAHGELRAGALDQVIEIFLRMLQRFAVGVFALAADVEIGIESLLQGQHFDLKFFFDQQAQRAFGGLGPRGIGIEVHDHILAEARRAAWPAAR